MSSFIHPSILLLVIRLFIVSCMPSHTVHKSIPVPDKVTRYGTIMEVGVKKIMEVLEGIHRRCFEFKRKSTVKGRCSVERRRQRDMYSRSLPLLRIFSITIPSVLKERPLYLNAYRQQFKHNGNASPFPHLTLTLTTSMGRNVNTHTYRHSPIPSAPGKSSFPSLNQEVPFSGLFSHVR